MAVLDSDESVPCFAFYCEENQREYYYLPDTDERTWIKPRRARLLSNGDGTTKQRFRVKDFISLASGNTNGSKYAIEVNWTRLAAVVAISLLLMLTAKSLSTEVTMNAANDFDTKVEVRVPTADLPRNEMLSTSEFAATKVDNSIGINNDSLSSEGEELSVPTIGITYPPINEERSMDLNSALEAASGLDAEDMVPDDDANDPGTAVEFQDQSIKDDESGNSDDLGTLNEIRSHPDPELTLDSDESMVDVRDEELNRQGHKESFEHDNADEASPSEIPMMPSMYDMYAPGVDSLRKNYDDGSDRNSPEEFPASDSLDSIPSIEDDGDTNNDIEVSDETREHDDIELSDHSEDLRASETVSEANERNGLYEGRSSRVNAAEREEMGDDDLNKNGYDNAIVSSEGIPATVEDDDGIIDEDGMGDGHNEDDNSGVYISGLASSMDEGLPEAASIDDHLDYTVPDSLNDELIPEHAIEDLTEEADPLLNVDGERESVEEETGYLQEATISEQYKIGETILMRVQSQARDVGIDKPLVDPDDLAPLSIMPFSFFDSSEPERSNLDSSQWVCKLPLAYLLKADCETKLS